MEVVRFSETLVSNHHTTWHDNPENHDFEKYVDIFIVVITIIITISCHRFPFPWYFSWTSGAPHHSDFRFQIVALSLRCPSQSCFLQRNYWMLSWYFQILFNPIVTIMTPMVTGMTKHFIFHIPWIYILRFFFNSFPASFCNTFLSDSTATYLVSNYYVWSIGQNYSIRFHPFIPQ
jgi:hypothetical protein